MDVGLNDESDSHSLICTPCGRTFRTMVDFDRHRSVFHPQMTSPSCNHCGTTFPSFGPLTAHRGECQARLQSESIPCAQVIDQQAPSEEKIPLAPIHTIEALGRSTPGLYHAQSSDSLRTPPETPLQTLQSNSRTSFGRTTDVLRSDFSPGLSSTFVRHPETENALQDTPGEDMSEPISDGSSPSTRSDQPWVYSDCLISPFVSTIPEVFQLENDDEDDAAAIEILALKGSLGMEHFPLCLAKIIQEHCNSLQNRVPSFLRHTWPQTNLAAPPGFACSIFVDPWQRQRVKAARYSYNNRYQIVVIAKTNPNSEDGIYEIVNFHRTVQLSNLDGSVRVQEWRKWGAAGAETNIADSILWLCFKDANAEQLNVQSKKISMILGEWCDHANKGRSTILDEATVLAFQSSGSDRTHSQENGNVGRHADGSEEDVRYLTRNRLAKIDSQEPGNKQSQVTKMFRNSAGALVRLCCIDCGRKDIKTVSGMKSHCIAKHGRRFEDKQEMVDLCGVELRGEEATAAENISDRESSPEADTSPTKPATARKRRKISANKHDPLVIFHSQFDPAKTRTMRFSCCQGIDKFFAHAQVADAADRSTYILSVKVGHGEPIQVIREDQEDFDEVMKAVNRVADEEGQQVLVTGAPLYE